MNKYFCDICASAITEEDIGTSCFITSEPKRSYYLPTIVNETKFVMGGKGKKIVKLLSFDDSRIAREMRIPYCRLHSRGQVRNSKSIMI